MNIQIVIPKLQKERYTFPNPLEASNDGLLAWGGDLNPKRLIKAYEEGIFPWFSRHDPLLWWSPNPRLVLYPQNFRVTKSLRKSKKKYEIRVNTNFEAVINACKTARVDTWINKQMKEAYISLHKLGYAKSVETYLEGELVGGLYGILIGSIFCGESMFSKKNDASKVALWYLCEQIQKYKGALIDCQMPTPHLLSLGATTLDRKEFLDILFIQKNKRIEIK